MRKFICIFVFAAAFSLPGLHAAPIQYAVSIDTSSVASGYLDFQFSAGGPAQDLYGVISGLNISTGQLGPAILDGDVTGSFPGLVTLSNVPGFSADFQQVLSFPSTLSFILTFRGPALDAPDAGVLFGTKFGLGILDDGLNPALPPTDLDGFNVTIDIGPRTFLSAAANGPSGAVNISRLPEPATVFTTGLAILCLVFWRMRRQSG